MTIGKKLAVLTAGIALTIYAISAPPMAHAEDDFLSALFGALGARPPVPPPPRMPLPFAEDGQPSKDARRAPASYGTGQAWCVRRCDGRYFPINGPDKVGACNRFCPASKTDVVYGSDIDRATTADGQPYSELPNAFRYRNEMIAGCTCTGAATGLAAISIENDPTLRKGDIVARPDGLMVAGRNAGKNDSAAMNFSPMSPRTIRAHFKQVPVVASE